MVFHTDLVNHLEIFQVLINPKGFGWEATLTIASNKAIKVNTDFLQRNPLLQFEPLIVEPGCYQLLVDLIRGIMIHGAIAMMAVIKDAELAEDLLQMVKVVK